MNVNNDAIEDLNNRCFNEDEFVNKNYNSSNECDKSSKSRTKPTNLLYKYNMKSLSQDESESIKNFNEPFKPPRTKSLNTEGSINSHGSKPKLANEKETGKNSVDAYFKTSASSNEGIKSQYQSSSEAVTVFSHQESGNHLENEFSPNVNYLTNRQESGIITNLNLLTKENSNSANSDNENKISNENVDPNENVNVSQKFNTNLILNNIKLLYDQNTDRSKKRSEQMKKMRCNRGSDKKFKLEDLEDSDDNNRENISKQENLKAVASILMEKGNEEHLCFENESEIENEENNAKNQDAEVMISDLDISLEGEEEEEKLGNSGIISQTTTGKSFVPITNSLITKNAIKEDNATPSYLLALSQYNNEEESASDNKKDQFENYDSLEREVLQIDDSKRTQSSKEVKHIRLPSGKNYLIHSIIIEEDVSENFTDSELSIKKKSYLFSKSKYDSSEKKMRISRGDAEVERNLESVFNSSSKTLYNSENKSRVASKSEVPSEFVEFVKKGKQPSHKIAKSEIFNIQIDLKKTLEEISLKKFEEDGLLKQKVENKKKELIDMFFHKSSDTAGFNFFNSESVTNPIGNNFNNENEKSFKAFKKPNTVNKFVINVQNAINNVSNNNISSPALKKSPSGQTREKYYQQNSNSNSGKSKKITKLDEQDLSKITKMSKEDFEMKLLSPSHNNKDNKDFFNEEENLLTFNETQNNNSNIILISNNNTNNYKAMKEKYKKERKKSSIFKSEDLRISKTEGNNLFISPRLYSNTNNANNASNTTNLPNISNIQNSIIDQCSYININNNINICSPISVNSIKNDIEYSIINEKKECDKTMTNPFDLLRNNSSNKGSSSQKRSCINLNLTISNNKNEGNVLIKRKLFDNSNSNSDIDNKNENNNTVSMNQPKVYSHMTISNEIHINILNKNPNNKENNKENCEGIKKSRKSSIDLFMNNKNTISSTIQTIPPKHNKTASMQTNFLIDYKKSIGGIMSNLNLKSFFSKKNVELLKGGKDLKDAKDAKGGKNESKDIININNNININNTHLNNFLKNRSNSNSSIKRTDSNSNMITHNTTNSNYNCVNTSPFGRVTPNDRCLNNNYDKINTNMKNRISPCNAKIGRATTPTIVKSKKASVPDIKHFLNFSSGSKKINANLDKQKDNSQCHSNVNIFNANNTLNNANNANNNIPKQPKLLKEPKKKPNSSRTASEIPPICNKLKIFEAMRYLVYKKTSNLDHHKTALEKLAKAKGMSFVILVEQNKLSYEFKGIYEISSDKQFLLKVYSLNFCPNVISLSEIVHQYSFIINSLNECKQVDSGFSSNVAAVSIMPKKTIH